MAGFSLPGFWRGRYIDPAEDPPVRPLEQGLKLLKILLFYKTDWESKENGPFVFARMGLCW